MICFTTTDRLILLNIFPLHIHRLICTIFVLPKWIKKQQELEDLKLQNEAMALKTKKFVQFLSAEKGDGDGEEIAVENADDTAHEDEDKSSNLEEKKDK